MPPVSASAPSSADPATLPTLQCYLDFVSPYAWIAFHRLPEVLQGLSVSVSYRPVFLGALLHHHQQRGPAEVPGKREWIYRHASWLARQHGVPFQMPPEHPFMPLPLLRLAMACSDEQGRVNRYVCERLFTHVWDGGGASASDPARLAALTEELAPPLAPDSPEVKQRLQAQTEQALQAQVFGVPAVLWGERLFWGVEGLPMLRAALDGEPDLDAVWDAPNGVRNGLPPR